jgi:signal transduction histidine kinase
MFALSVPFVTIADASETAAESGLTPGRPDSHTGLPWPVPQDKKLSWEIIHGNMDIDSEFEEGRILGHAQEQQRLVMHFHDQLGPDLMALAFSIESLREQMKADGNPAEPKLREIQDRLSKILVLIRQVTLDGKSESS